MSEGIKPLPNTDDIDTLTGALDTGTITTAQGRHRQAQAPVPEPVAAETPPEWESWYRTDEAYIWFCTRRKGMGRREIAADTGKKVNAVDQALHKARNALERMRAVPGFSETDVMDDIAMHREPEPEMTEEESMAGFEGMTYAQINRVLSTDTDPEPESYPDEPEPEDFYTGG